MTGVFGLFAQGYWPVAALVFFGAIAAPAFHLAAVSFLEDAASAGGGPNWSGYPKRRNGWNLGTSCLFTR